MINYKEEKDAGGHGSEKHHVLAFGRMNPITSGHEAVVNKLHSVAKENGASHSLVVSHSQDAKKNPLTGEQKVAHAKNAFPGTKVSSASKEAPTILHHAAAAHAAGATHLHVIAGSDRHEEMHNLLHKYNGKDAAHGHYNFKNITVHSSGERDPDAEGTTGISASKMREHAASGNKAEFHKGAPSKMKPEHKDAMYNDVRKGMNIKEELRPEMGAGAYVNDFIASTNPRFNNKSKEERRRMAIGAFMAAKSRLKEGTLQGNIGGGDAMNTTTSAPSASTSKDTTMGKKIKGFKFFNGENDKQMNMNQPVKEEVEEIEEGGQIYGKPPQSVKIDTTLKFKPTGEKTSGDNPLKKPFTVPSQRSNAPAGAKSVKESVLDKIRSRVSGELEQSSAHRQALAAAQNQAAIDRVHNHAATHAASAAHDQHHWQQASKEKENNHAAKLERDKIQQAHYNTQRDKINSAFTKKVTKEEVEHIDELSISTLKSYIKNAKVNKKFEADTQATAMRKNDHMMASDSAHKIQQRKQGIKDAKAKLNTEEAKKEDPPFDGPYKSTFKKPNNPNRTGMDSARSLAQRAMDQLNKNKPVKEEKDEQEYGYEGDMALNQLATLTRCAEMIKDTLKPDTDLPEWVQSKITLATDYIQTAADYLYSESEVNEQAPVAPVPDKKYIKGTPEHKAYKATKKPINGMPTNVKEEAEELDEKSDQAKQNKTMKNMMDASRGARYKLNNPVPDTDHKTAREKNVAIGRALRNEATAQKGVNVDKVNHAGDTPHEEKWEEAPKTVSKLKKVKEDNMKSYKEFLQSLDEKLIGKQHKIDKNKNGKVDSHDFELLRKEEADHLLEYTPGPDGKTIIKGRSYGADYVDPEGADETAADMKKADKKPAGRKTGQRTGSYKPRATISKLKSAGSTYK